MRAPPPHRRRLARALRRPAFAVVAALVWLLGVELGPGLHIARHGELGHHHHGASEALACASHEDAADDGHEHHDTAAGHHAHHSDHDDHERHAAAEHHAVERHEHHEHHDAGGHHEHHAADDHHATGHPHDHDEAEPHDPVSHEAEPVDPRAHAPGSVPHGAGSLAHRDLVPLTPPLVLPPILSAPWRPVVVVQVLRITPRERTPTVLRARGPPRGRSTPAPLSLA